MDYQIALSPEIGITPAEFVAAWNAAPETRAAAEAKLEPSPKGFGLLEDTLPLLHDVSLGLAINALYDLIKGALEAHLNQKTEAAAKHSKKKTKFIEVDQPGGVRTIVVTVEEE